MTRAPSASLNAQDILIHQSQHETRVALMEQSEVQELHIERHAQRGVVGNVYLGKITRVLPGMQSAFVEFGLERAGFLHVADLWQHKNSAAARDADKLTPIEKLVFEGQTLMVQVVKDPLGSKGARLSSQISLAGRYMVLLPQDSHVGMSQKIAGDAARAVLKTRLEAALPAGFQSGLIARTQAADASTEQLAADIGMLTQLWGEMQQLARTKPAPLQLHSDLTLAQRALRDLCTDATRSITVDGADCHSELQSFAARYMPAVLPKLQRHEGERPLFDLANIDDEVGRALERRVALKSGAYLVIDQTESMCTVDVNTGAFVGHKNFDDTILRTNLQAAGAIARQLRLRNLGGIILIDFIDMTRADHRAQVQAELERQLARDAVRTDIHGFTALGLMELTRKRTRESLSHQLCQPCPVCDTRGHIRTAQTVCYAILREIELQARQFNAQGFSVIAHPAVVDRLMEEEASALAQLEASIGKKVALQVDFNGAQEAYEVILM